MESSYKADFKQPLSSHRSATSEGSGRSKTASQRSVGRYKRVQGGVDESLFGGEKSESRRSSTANRAKDVERKAPSKVEMDSIVLTSNDLDRIRRAAAPVDQQDGQDDFDRKAREAVQEKARERKQRMLAMEEQRKARQEKSDLEIEDHERSQNINSNAAHTREETLDPVKNMNSQVET
jgi:hypothetical protein